MRDDLAAFEESERIAAHVDAIAALTRIQLAQKAKPRRWSFYWNLAWACYCMFWVGYDVAQGKYWLAAVMAILTIAMLVFATAIARTNERIAEVRGQANAVTSSFAAIRAFLQESKA